MTSIILTIVALLIIHTFNEIDFFLKVKKEAARKTVHVKRKPGFKPRSIINH